MTPPRPTPSESPLWGAAAWHTPCLGRPRGRPGLGAPTTSAMLTTETSYAARALRQESGQLNEPCHCGQTPRLPENKQRRGLEATAEAGRHDLPSWASTRLADGQVFLSIQAGRAVLRKREVEPPHCRTGPRGLLPLPQRSSPATSAEHQLWV